MLSQEDIRIDTRALAVFRIGLGVLLIIDVILRTRNFYFFYTDEGVVPYSVVETVLWENSAAVLPVYVLSSHTIITVVLFCAAAIVGLCLVMGWQTRFMTVVGFLLVSMIDARNPFVLSYADHFFHFMFFWGMFLPLGERYSIDSINTTKKNVRSTVVSVWSALVLFQVVYMYISNGSYKFTHANHSLPTDILPVLFSLDHVTFSGVNIISIYVPTIILQSMSALWMILMLSSPLLFFLRGHKRTVCTSFFLIAHISMAGTMRIGAFPYAVICGLLLFIPTVTWDFIEQKFSKHTIAKRSKIKIERFGKQLAAYSSVVEPSINTQKQLKNTTLSLSIGLFVVASVFVTVLFIGGVTDVTESTDETAVEYVDNSVRTFGLRQPTWDFYTSPPPYYDRFYVVIAESSTGERIDVLNERNKSFERPHGSGKLNKQYSRTYRERFFWGSVFNNGSEENITDKTNPSPELRQELTRHYCSSEETKELFANSDGDIESVSFYRINEEITIENREDRDSRNVTIVEGGEYECPV